MKTYYALVMFITILSLLVLETNSARILCVFPTPSVSHQYVFRPYTEELARRGHELVILTTDPYLPKDIGNGNVTEIDLKFSYEYLKQSYELLQQTLVFKKGVIIDEEIQGLDFVMMWFSIYDRQFKHKEIQKIIDGNKNFDLIVIEGLAEYYLILSNFFKAPVISFSSFYGIQSNLAAMGAVSQHPKLHPNLIRSNFDTSTLWNEIKNIYYDFKMADILIKAEKGTSKLLKARFGPNTPTILELRENIDLLFVNAHPIYDYNRAVPPGVVYLGALHLRESKELPQDLKTYLDNSKRGVIYVSLGTNVRVNNMDKELLNIFLNAIRSVPYDVLWKFDADMLETKPENAEIRKWFPQRDLLMHPNIKLFVTQGGLQSTDETIDAGVPIVCIPFLGDQFYNCHRSAELGIGVQVDPRLMTTDDLTKAILTVAGNKSYRKNIKKLRELIRDQPQTPLERAIWWTEYVIRHGGARHLRSPAANLSWSEYLMLDVIVPVVISVIVALILLIFLIRYLYSVRIILKFNDIKKKTI